MEQKKYASVTDVRKKTSEVFAQADSGADVLLLSHNKPRYVLITFQKFNDLMSELEDRQDIKSINKARKSKSKMLGWPEFKKQVHLK